MSETTAPEASTGKIIEGKKGLADLAASFEWLSPENKTNDQVIAESIKAIVEELGCQEQEKDLKQFVQKIRQKAIAVYQKIYPPTALEPSGEDEQNLILKEPYYHGVGKDNKWTGHNDYVAACASRLFLGMVRLQKTKETGKTYDDFFGKDWNLEDRRLTISDFKSLMAIAYFHEAGEWWVRKFCKDALAEQQKQFESTEKTLLLSRIKNNPNLKDIIGVLPRNAKQEFVERIKTVIKEIKESIKDTDLEVEYNPKDNPTEFYSKFKGGKISDLDFSSPKEKRGDKPAILASLLRAADFSQILCPSYLEAVNYKNGQGKIGEKRLGPLLLWLEFYTFRPKALASFGWFEPENTNISRFFIENFFNHNFNNPAISGIMEKAFGDKDNFYTQQLEKLLSIVEK